MSKSPTLILGFKLDKNDVHSISLPRGEQWTIHFTETCVFVEFGQISKSGEHVYNNKSITKFKKRNKYSKLGVWDLSKFQTEKYNHTTPSSESVIEERLGLPLQTRDEEDDEFDEYYDPISKRFYTSSLSLRGDSLPFPVKSKESLDNELEEYTSRRDTIKSLNT